MRDLRNFETFYWVARSGGFRAAAIKLHTTQPAVSARIAQLEQELGVNLFDPNNRRASLTARGSMLLTYVERILRLKDEMISAVADPTAMRGKFTIGVSETLVYTWLSDLIESISTDFPNITIDLSVDTTPEITRRLLALDVDLALMAEPLEHANACSEKLCSYPFRFIAAPRFARACDTPEDEVALFSQQPVITYPASTVTSAALEVNVCKTLELADIRLWGMASIHTIVDMVKAGHGVGALSPVNVKKELDAGSLVILDSRVKLPDFAFHAVYLTGANAHLKQSICTRAHLAANAYGQGPE
ncbi:LysR family transcriptional regulator [Achromobacter sp. RTa]|uniref:LysR family transcriptional regulator n=1 Tax=Achromobacter sp. RTa TaxID=1532557 RepID=UPI000689462F|nr:LysR family transcriptional regulator [Achromobacter sp. RTa]